MLRRVLAHPIRFTSRLTRFLLMLLRAGLDGSRMRLRGEVSRPERNQWMRKWSRHIASSLDIKINVHGHPPKHGLLVANHLSYLDIIVLGTTTPATFLSKAEVRWWPAIGWLTQFAGTLYVKREKKKDLHALAESFSEVWEEKSLIVMFPEGTSSNGETILPFRSSLLKPACDNQQPVTPAYVRYVCEGGTLIDDVYFWGDMAFAPHLIRMLCLESVSAEIHFGATRYPQGQDRKEITKLLREDILAMKSDHP
jgi:1-acyl-sn-glycerol-3-phosphate acyltransferase